MDKAALTPVSTLPPVPLDRPAAGPSFAAALCGFLSTTVATTMLMFLLSSV